MFLAQISQETNTALQAAKITADATLKAAGITGWMTIIAAGIAFASAIIGVIIIVWKEKKDRARWEKEQEIKVNQWEAEQAARLKRIEEEQKRWDAEQRAAQEKKLQHYQTMLRLVSDEIDANLESLAKTDFFPKRRLFFIDIWEATKEHIFFMLNATLKLDKKESEFYAFIMTGYRAAKNYNNSIQHPEIKWDDVEEYYMIAKNCFSKASNFLHPNNDSN
jgi:hypothetical protein